jgi:ATP-dependent protease ClpP protease subunit
MCQKAIKAIGASKHSDEVVENKVSLSFNGFIGSYENSIENLDVQLLNVRSTEIIDISINSDGGSYFEAMKLYDRLAQLTNKKRIRISPMAASAAAVLALVPQAEVSIPENGLLRHHMPMLSGGDPKNAEELKEVAEQLETIESTLITMVAAKCGKSSEVVKAFLNEDKWMTAQQALDFGLVDKVTPLTRRKTRVSNLVLPEQIVAHLDSLNKRSEKMALKDVCGKLSLTITDEMEDDQLEELIVNHITELGKAKGKVKETPKDPPKFGDGILNMLVTNRDLEITNLVKEGKITPAVGDKLKEQFAKKDTILNCVDAEGTSVDNFDNIIAALKENEKVVNFGGRTKTSLPKGDEGQQHDGLVKNAMARAKARGTV